jgi:FMN phosphatase YigB (HAD superfamily)
MIYIFDIDGTLADISHRLHLIGAEKGGFTPYTEKKDWDGFYKAAVDDKPIFEVITVARSLHMVGHTIVYSTGRTESIREITMQWLNKYRLPAGKLFMRADKDHREDCVVKSELLDKILIVYGHLALPLGGVFEDRQQVVEMYRARGIRVYQVAKGDF